MGNAIKTIVDDTGGRKEIYDHDRVDGHFASGLKLKPVPHMTQGQQYKILEEKLAKEAVYGMIYVVKDDKGEKRNISDKYFEPASNVLTFENAKTDWSKALDLEKIRSVASKMSNIDDHCNKIKKDFNSCSAIDDMPKFDRSPKPTVVGLKEEYEANIQLNKLAGTWKEKAKHERQPLPLSESRYQKSSIEVELEVLRETCLDMVERIDAMSNAVEAVRKFA